MSRKWIAPQKTLNLMGVMGAVPALYVLEKTAKHGFTKIKTLIDLGEKMNMDKSIAILGNIADGAKKVIDINAHRKIR